MKPQHVWKFAATLPEVDVPRILREAGEASDSKSPAVRITIDGQVFTATSFENAVKAGILHSSQGFVDETVYAAKNVFGDTVVRNVHPPYASTVSAANSGATVIFRGDYIKEILNAVRVETLVEVF